jgi:amino acid adenylation domain-containing protein
MLETLPLSLPQQDIFYDQLRFPGSPVYNIGAIVWIDGVVDGTVFERAYRQLVAECDALRIVVDTGQGQVRMAFARHEGNPVESGDFSGHGPHAGPAAREFISRAFNEPFELVPRNLLHRFYLLKISDQQYIFFSKYHHLVADGWGTSLIFKRLTELYNEIFEKGSFSPKPLFSYRDFVADDLAYKHSERFDADGAFWQEKFRTLPESVFTRPATPGNGLEAATGVLFLTRGEYQSVEELSKALGVTEFITFVALLVSYFKIYHHASDAIVGLPILNRGNRHFRQTVGLFMNVLPLRVACGGQTSFARLAATVKEELRKCFRHQRFPLGHVITAAAHPGERSRFYDLFLSYEKHDYQHTFSGCDCRVEPLCAREARSGLSVYVRDYAAGQDVKVEFHYQKNLFPGDQADTLVARFRHLVAAVAGNAHGDVLKTVFVPERDQHVLRRLNSTQTRHADALLGLHELVSRQCHRSPAKTAVTCRNASLTYRALDEQSSGVARWLTVRHNIRPGDLVGLVAERSERMLVLILGILKSGGVYVPLDPWQPAARNRAIVEDSRPVLLVAEKELEADESMPPWVLAGDLLADGGGPDAGFVPVPVEPARLAYVMYTSGSSGLPKGVGVTHGAVVNFLLSMHAFPGMQASDCLLSVTSHTFDISILEFFLPLYAGATLVMATRSEVTIPSRLIALMAAAQPTLMQATPTLWNALRMSGWPGDANLRVLSGGERLAKDLGLFLLDRCRQVYNLYGPTEATVWCTAMEVREEADIEKVGKPVANATIHVFNEALAQQPLGVAGEVYAGGACLAAGYVNKPELTHSRYLLHPGTGARLYRTGDLGKFDPQGNLVILGRVDDQLKINGIRVEPAEIELHLKGLPGVLEAVVVGHDQAPHGKQLAAFLLSTARYSLGEVQARLAGKVAASLLPSRVAYVDSFPQTPNGKTDRKALSTLAGTLKADEEVTVQPENAVEATLAALWGEVLHTGPVSVTADFFALGGTSLGAGEILSAIHRHFGVWVPLEAFFRAPTVRSIARQVNRGTGDTTRAASGGNGSHYPLPPHLRRLWLACQTVAGHQSYHLSLALRLEGHLDEASFCGAWSDLLNRHEALRTAFVALEGEPFAAIAPEGDFRYACSIDPHPAGKPAEELLAAERNGVFELDKPPLARSKVFRLGPASHLAVFTLHHLVADEPSFPVFFRDLAELYNGRTLGKVPLRHPPAAQLGDSLQRISALAAGQAPAQDDGYGQWVNGVTDAHRFGAPVHAAGLPAAGPVRHCRVALGEEISTRLRGVAHAARVSPFVVQCAVIMTLLQRYSGEKKIGIAVPVTYRDLPGLPGQIGYYLTVMPLAVEFNPEDTFLSLLAKTQAGVAAAHQYKYRYAAQAGADGVVATSVVVSEENYAVGDLPGDCPLAGLTIGRVLQPAPPSRFPLEFRLVRTPNQFTLEVQYGEVQYGRDLPAARLGDHLRQLAGALSAHPQRPYWQCTYVLPAERHLVLNVFNQALARPRTTLLEGFAAVVAATPAAEAIRAEDASISYSELDAVSDRLAAAWGRRFGVRHGDAVVIYLENAAEFIFTVLATLKLGAAYIPVDLAVPAGRVERIIGGASPKLLVTNREGASRLSPAGVPHVLVEDFPAGAEAAGGRAEVPARPVHPEDIAYTMFTSGTTGEPKGVPIRHGSVVDLVTAMASGLAISAKDRILQFSSVSFDASVFEIFAGLLTGACVVIFPRKRYLPGDQFVAYARRQRVTLTLLPPSYLALLDAEALHFLRVLISGGEKLAHALARRLSRVTRLFNAYGPTECTVCATLGELTPDGLAAGGLVPIGRPLPGSQVYILDEYQQPAGIGVRGQLAIAGASLSPGYANDPDLTARKFRPSPFDAASRVYLTGDCAYWREDGTLAFVGRLDDQVKINGIRLEPADVAGALQLHPLVKHAVVLAEPRGAETGLAGFYATDHPLTPGDLRAFLRQHLPGYMIPARLVPVAAFPALPNGKIDLQQLRAMPGRGEAGTGTAPTGSTAVMQKLAALWQALLPGASLDVHTNFFDAGGHSLLVIRVLNQVRRTFNAGISYEDFMRNATLHALAALVEARQAGGSGAPQDAIAAQPVDPRGIYPASHAQQRLWLLSTLYETGAAYNVAGGFALRVPVDQALLQQAFYLTVARHESLRTSFLFESGELKQKIHPVEAVNPRVGFHVTSTPEALDRLLAQSAARAFDLSTPSLIDLTLIVHRGEQYLLLVVMHHIICDAWSLPVLTRDLTECYGALLGAQTATPAPLRIQYKDYAAWQLRNIASGQWASHRAFWTARLTPPLPANPLLTDYPRSARRTFAGDAATLAFAEPVSRAVAGLGKTYNQTPFVVLFSVLQAVLAETMGWSDVLTGMVVAGRNHPDLEEQVGFYVNTLPVRTPVAPDDTLGSLLHQTAAAVSAALDHQLYPFDALLEALEYPKAPNRNPLFDVVAVYNLDAADGLAPGPFGALETFRVPAKTSKFDLTVEFMQTRSGLTARIEYNSDLFRQSSIEALLLKIECLCGIFAEQPDLRINALSAVLHRKLLVESSQETTLDFDFEN